MIFYILLQYMSKFKVWIFLYILIWAMNLSISYADLNTEVEVSKAEINTENK